MAIAVVGSLVVPSPSARVERIPQADVRLEASGSSTTFEVASDGSFRPFVRGHSEPVGLLKTMSVARGATELLDAPTLTRASTYATISRGEVIEEIADRAGAIEQSWSFAKRPSGAGDLVVRVRASGLTLRANDEHGLRFDDRTTGTRLTYGTATWIDARGVRSSVPTRVEGSDILIAVASTILEQSAYPAVLDPLIAAELAPGTVVPGPSNGRSPAVVFDGTNYLVVWSGNHVLGTRVTPAGALLDPVGLPIFRSTLASAASPVSASFDGANTLVAWVSRTSVANTSVFGASAVRVSKSGVNLDTEIVLATSGARPGVNLSAPNPPAVAFDGQNQLVVWETPTGFGFGRVSPAGVALDPTPHTVLAPAATLIGAACDGVTCLVAWMAALSQNTSTLFGMRIARDGTVLDLAPIVVASNVAPQSIGGRPRVAFDGTKYAIAYRGGNGSAYLGRVSPDGSVSPAIPTALYLAATDAQVSVTYDNAALNVVAHGANGGRVFVRIDPAGNVVAGPTYHSVTHLRSSDLAGSACGPSGCLAAWADVRDDPWTPRTTTNIYASRFDITGAWLDGDGIRLSSSAQKQNTVRVAPAGPTPLLVWGEHIEKSERVWAARVGANGALLETGVDLGEGANAFAASDGTSHLVVWSHGGVMGRRVSGGAPLDASPILISPGTATFVSFDGANYVVISRGNGDVGIATRVSPSGVVLDPTGIVLPFLPAASAFNGSCHLLVWEHKLASGASDLYAIRVDRAGTPLDPEPFPLSTGLGGRTSPAAASDGTDFVVVWEDGRSVTKTSIYAARITGAGVVVDPTGLAVAASPPSDTTSNRAPDIAYVPALRRYVVGFTRAFPVDRDVYGVTLDSSANVGIPFAIEASRDRSVTTRGQSIAVLGGTRAVVAYTRDDPKPPFGTTRARAAIVDLADDTSIPDGGAGSTDGGVDADAGANVSDAGPAADAGSGDDSPTHPEGDACLCSVPMPGTKANLGRLCGEVGLLGGIAFLRRRRRRAGATFAQES